MESAGYSMHRVFGRVVQTQDVVATEGSFEPHVHSNVFSSQTQSLTETKTEDAGIHAMDQVLTEKNASSNALTDPYQQEKINKIIRRFAYFF